jgi:hypothetical protein
MIALSGSVDLARHGRIAVVTVDNPPANALSHVRKGLKDDRERHRGTRTRLSVPLPPRDDEGRCDDQRAVGRGNRLGADSGSRTGVCRLE